MTSPDVLDDTLDTQASGDDERPRVLLVTDRSPGVRTGHAIRTANVIDGLAVRFQLHVVLVDVTIEGDELPDDGRYTTSVVRTLRRSPAQRVLGVASRRPTDIGYKSRRRVRRQIAEAVGDKEWDVLWSCRARVHDLTSHLPARRRIIDFDDLNDLLLRSKISDRTARNGPYRSLFKNAWDWLDSLRWSRHHRRIATVADRVLVCSRSDLDHLDVPNAAVLENGYPDPTRTAHSDVPAPSLPDARTSSPSVPGEIIFVGAMTYEPNLLAVQWFATQVLPIVRRSVPQARLTVVGAQGQDLVDGKGFPGVRFVGEVREVGPFYADADIAVTPLHSGGGTRIKVIEALARSVPLVTTSFGCVGHGLSNGSNALIADDEDGFARACVRLLADPDLRAQLALGGRSRFLDDLDAVSCGDRAAQIVSDTLAEPRVVIGGVAAHRSQESGRSL